MARNLYQKSSLYYLPRICRKRGWIRYCTISCITLYILLWLFAIFNYRTRCRLIIPQVNNIPGYCSVNVNDLVLNQPNMSKSVTIPELEAEITNTNLGGQWQPTGCKAQLRVAILIPYRNRWPHLKILLRKLHPMLQKQKLHYQVFVINQAGDEPFNRGLVKNIGFVEALKDGDFDCFVYHDVDMIPEHDQNLYYCDDSARHLSAAVDEWRYHSMYYNMLAGVIMMSKASIERVNGYSNLYWAWGNEDDEISARTEEIGMTLTRPPVHIARYKMVRHVKEWRGENENGLFKTWRSRWKNDGVNSLEGRYKVIKISRTHLYTNVTVQATPPNKEEIEKAMQLPQVSLWWLITFYYP